MFLVILGRKVVHIYKTKYMVVVVVVVVVEEEYK